jgi:uncharacterized protein
VSCCPTNVARTLASLGAYLATTDDDGVQVHQYFAGEIRAELSDGAPVALRVETDYPADGRIRVTVLSGPDRSWTLSLRVPGWAGAGAVLDGQPVRPGYATVTRASAAGDTVELDLPVRARWTWPDPRIDAIRGTVAVERGPVVLCLESTDPESGVRHARVHTDADPVERDGTVLVPITLVDTPDTPWPYGERPVERSGEARLTPLIPYHCWGNGGPSTMRVWLPRADQG